MQTYRQLALQLLNFIDQSPTAFHATEQTAALLSAAGFEELRESDPWKLSPSDRRYVIRNDSAIVAFIVGSAPPETAGFMLVGAHTDSPALKLKPHAMLNRRGYRQLGVEPYGGMLLSTWMDRDLGLAGRVVLDRGNGDLEIKLLHVKKPILRIPNLAIHLNREVNDKGLILDKQKHMPPILGLAKTEEESENLLEFIAKEFEKQGQTVKASDIVDFDLSLVDLQPSTLGGLEEEFFFAPRLDNLASCHAALRALIDASKQRPDMDITRGIVFWDNEECGSRSMQGAQGPFLPQILGRIVHAHGSGNADSIERAFANSFLVSADMAHAIHPNYAERHEPDHIPLLGQGPVIKSNANQSYASDGISSARFVQACRQVGFEPQRFVVRSDLPSGSTIGPITAALTGIKTVDVGNPMLSMHSIREMGAVQDHSLMVDVLDHLFGVPVAKKGNKLPRKKTKK